MRGLTLLKPTLLAIVLVICFSVANGSATSSEPTSHGREIIFAIGQMPLNLDPRYATDAASERVNRLIYQSLVDFDQHSRPTPSLASWLVLSNREFQFTLKAKRSAFNTPTKIRSTFLNARDVKATYDSFTNLADSPHAAEFSNIQEIAVLNDDTLIFKLKKDDANFPTKLLIGILPAALVEKNHDFSHHPVGSGSIQLLDWGNKLTLQRVKDGQRISLLEVKDPTVRVLKLLHGEVDLLQGELPSELIQHLESKSEITLKNSVGANFSYLGLNMQDPILQSLKVRQAIAHAIDRETIIAKVMTRQTRLASAILPPEHYTNHKSALPAYDYNPKRARQLLLEAGVQLPLKLVYKTSTDAQRVRLATIMQAQMAEAGIDLEIRSLDWGTFFADVKQGNFQLYGLTWVGIKTPEIYRKVFGSDSFPPHGFNRGRFSDASLDQLLVVENWPAVTKRIHAQLPYIPLWYEGQFAAMRNNIIHFTPKTDGNWDDLAKITYRKAH